jgi:hypothetical protein
MGEGTFGKVVEVGRRVRAQCGPIDTYMGVRGVQAWDREKRKYLAVKIIRNVPKCGLFSRPLFGLGGCERTALWPACIARIAFVRACEAVRPP